jgi:hypothetical protein
VVSVQHHCQRFVGEQPCVAEKARRKCVAISKATRTRRVVVASWPRHLTTFRAAWTHGEHHTYVLRRDRLCSNGDGSSGNRNNVRPKRQWATYIAQADPLDHLGTSGVCRPCHRRLHGTAASMALATEHTTSLTASPSTSIRIAISRRLRRGLSPTRVLSVASRRLGLGRWPLNRTLTLDVSARTASART